MQKITLLLLMSLISACDPNTGELCDRRRTGIDAYELCAKDSRCRMTPNDYYELAQVKAWVARHCVVENSWRR